MTRIATALLIAAIGGARLVAAGADASLPDAAQHKDARGVRELLSRKVDVNASQPDGMTALHWAVYYDDLDLVGRLLGAGANARAANRYGVTPLALA